MRTNIVLNDDLMREARRYSNASTKSGLVEEALRLLVEVRSAEERRKTYEARLLGIQQALAGRRFREGATALVRQDRERL
jgi:Arc/MetJ family transcription regulator